MAFHFERDKILRTKFRGDSEERMCAGKSLEEREMEDRPEAYTGTRKHYGMDQHQETKWRRLGEDPPSSSR